MLGWHTGDPGQVRWSRWDSVPIYCEQFHQAKSRTPRLSRTAQNCPGLGSLFPHSCNLFNLLRNFRRKVSGCKINSDELSPIQNYPEGFLFFTLLGTGRFKSYYYKRCSPSLIELIIQWGPQINNPQIGFWSPVILRVHFRLTLTLHFVHDRDDFSANRRYQKETSNARVGRPTCRDAQSSELSTGLFLGALGYLTLWFN